MRHRTKCTETEVTQWIMNTKKNLVLWEPKVQQTSNITIHCFLLYSLSCELHHFLCCQGRWQQSKTSRKTWNSCTYRKAQNNLNSTQSCDFYNIYLNRYIIKRCILEKNTFWRYIVAVLWILVKLTMSLNQICGTMNYGWLRLLQSSLHSRALLAD